eukprot:6381207-Amphidinium_carterae.1
MLYRLWARIRAPIIKDIYEQYAPEDVTGGRTGVQVQREVAKLRAQLEKAAVKDLSFVGFHSDISAAYDC